VKKLRGCAIPRTDSNICKYAVHGSVIDPSRKLHTHRVTSGLKAVADNQQSDIVKKSSGCPEVSGKVPVFTLIGDENGRHLSASAEETKSRRGVTGIRFLT